MSLASTEAYTAPFDISKYTKKEEIMGYYEISSFKQSGNYKKPFK